MDWGFQQVQSVLKNYYLNPKLELLVDEAIDLESREKLKINLEKNII